MLGTDNEFEIAIGVDSEAFHVTNPLRRIVDQRAAAGGHFEAFASVDLNGENFPLSLLWPTCTVA